MDSPSVNKRSRPRRSLSLRTPSNLRKSDVIVLDSPEISFSGSPSLSTSVSDSRLNLECSTPVNHNRKRSFFVPPGEDGSPCVVDSALDVSVMAYQASPSLPYTMSQEMRKVGVDVVWQWNSPKRNFHPDKKEEGMANGRKRRKSFTTSSSSTAAAAANAGLDKAKGFYKIREELLKAKKEEGQFMRLLQEEIAGEPQQQAHKKPVCESGKKGSEEGVKSKQASIQEGDATLLSRKLSDEFLNDSDNDENMLIISQEAENKVLLECEKKELQKDQNLEKETKLLKTPTTALQNRELNFSNDSFDQYLIDIPFDELLNRNALKLDQTVVNSPAVKQRHSGGGGGAASSSGSSGKGTLNRTLSMPSDTEQFMIVEKAINAGGSSTSTNSRSMARHESMPMKTRQGNVVGVCVGNSSSRGQMGGASKYSISNPSLTTMPISSSTESLYSTTSSTEKAAKICSQVEIAKKRQIAQERLKLRKLELTQRQAPVKEQPRKK